MVRIAALLFLACVFGCSDAPIASPEPSKEPPVEEKEVPSPPEKNALREQLLAGRTHVIKAIEHLADSSSLAQQIQNKATPEFAEAAADLLTSVYSSSSKLKGEVASKAPNLEEVKANPGRYQGERDVLAETINEVLKAIREQEGVAADLGENGPPEMRGTGRKLDGKLNEVIDSLLSALHELGAADKGPQDQPDTGDHVPPGYNPGN